MIKINFATSEKKDEREKERERKQLRFEWWNRLLWISYRLEMKIAWRIIDLNQINEYTLVISIFSFRNWFNREENRPIKWYLIISGEKFETKEHTTKIWLQKERCLVPSHNFNWFNSIAIQTDLNELRFAGKNFID